MPTRWTLFVDESGGFVPGEPSFVVGLAVEAHADALAGGRLRMRLEDIWGPGPWPPHATNLRFPAARVLYAARQDARAMRAGRFAAPLHAALRTLTAALEETPLATRLDAIRGGAFPAWHDCCEADHLLRQRAERERAPGSDGVRVAYDRVRAVAEAQDLAMGDLLREVFAHVPGMVVAARADDGPAGPAPGRHELRQDAYVRALGVLLERLARLAGPHEVECFVLTRFVEVGGLGAEVGMQGYLLRGLFEAATAATGSPVRFRAGGATLRYRDDLVADLHPMLVLADWVANRLRSAAGRFGRGYAALVDTLEQNRVVPRGALMRVPSRAPDVGPLPTLAAAGAPEDAVRAAFSAAAHAAARAELRAVDVRAVDADGRPPPSPTAGPPDEAEGPAWARDQAGAWITAARSWP